MNKLFNVDIKMNAFSKVFWDSVIFFSYFMLLGFNDQGQAVNLYDLGKYCSLM